MEHPLISTAISVLVLLAIWCVLPACASVSTVPKMTVAPSQVTMSPRSCLHWATIPLYPFSLQDSFSGLTLTADVHS